MSDKRERTLKMAARYLGLKGNALRLSAGIEPLLNAAYEEMLSVAAPRHVLKRALVRVDSAEGKPFLRFGDLLPVHSNDLCRVLDGCAEGCALLATLGMELDLRIRSLSVTDPALAAAIGACGSAYIDEYIDGILAAQGIALTPRFSPGYGDAPLSMQPALLRFLDAPRLGVYLTEGLLMIPEKSVSALLGIREAPAGGREVEDGDSRRCALCGQKECAFREKA